MKTFSNPWVLFLLIFGLAAMHSLIPAAVGSGPGSAGAGTEGVYLIPIEEEIGLGLSAFVKRAALDIKESGAGAVVFEVNTFGGRVDAALEIAGHVESLAPVPVYAFVKDRAWSAGALISLSCGKIFMRPGSSIGSAAPVSAAGGKTQALGEKYVSAIRAKFRSLAEKNGYPPLLAAAMVDKDIEVHRAVIDGKEVFLTPDELKKYERRGKIISKGSVETIIGKGKLLNLTAVRALKYGVASDVIESVEKLLESEGIIGTPVPMAKTFPEKLAGFLTRTAVTSLILMLGLMLISAEFHAPGFGWPGIAGLTCLAAVYWGHHVVNLAQWTDILLILAGLALLVMEIFVIPGFGVFGISGFACLVIGLYLMFVPFVIPNEPWEFERLKEVFLIMLVAFAGGGIAGFVLLFYLIPRLPMFSRPSLNLLGSRSPSPKAEGSRPSSTGDGEQSRAVTGPRSVQEPACDELLVGQQGLSITRIAPSGTGQFGVHIVEVASQGPQIPSGVTIEIVDKQGSLPVVKEV